MPRSTKATAVIVSLLAAVFILAAASPSFAADPKPKELWDKVKAKWNTINSYECDLFTWNYRTPSFLKNFPEHASKDKDKPDKPDWDYRVFNIRWKKPDKVLLMYKTSKNEDLSTGSLIDISIAYVLTYIPGTVFNYGHKDKKNVYIIFPYISDKAFNALPVPAKYKASMKILMIASRKEVYHNLPEELKDNRGNLLTETSIGIKMKQFEHYFKDGKVSISKVPMPKETDYALDAKSGWVTPKKPSGAANVYKLTMIPNDVKKNRGISKAEVFINPENNMFVGLTEYEGPKLVQVLLFSDLKLNPDLPDKLWDDFFKGRSLSDKN